VNGWRSTDALGVLLGLLLGFGSAGLAATSDETGEDGARPQPAPAATTTVVAADDGLVPLRIAGASHEDSYERDAFGSGWRDADGDCQDTRAEVLIEESEVDVSFTTADECRVRDGLWRSPWSGVENTEATLVQVDHMVPLANAWRSGAWAWSRAERVTFANELSDPDHLVALPRSENASKSDRGPEEWTPRDPDTYCAYALAWNRIKADWDLSATQEEWDALVAMAATC
jgi:hypothetical protein